ncbi:MAG: glycosyltransferase family 4 protein [Candidatus Omnitrophota bacterium]|jgi:glycosyltransferase involved in cell wall biosynthesis
MDKINVAFLRGSQRGRNILLGAEKIILSIAEGIDREAFDPLIIVLQGEGDALPPLASEARNSGLRVEIVKLKGKFDRSSIGRLRNILLTNKIDILHANEYRSDIIGFLAARHTNARTIATAHGWLYIDPKIKLYEWIDSMFLRAFDEVIAVSGAMKNELAKAGIPQDKLKIIENALDYSDIRSGAGSDIRKEIGAGPETIIVGSVGRLSLERGYEYLLDAAKEILGKCSDIKFLIAGDGDLKNSLIARAQRLGIKEKIVFLGFRKDVKNVYAALDIFVSSSLRESFGLALVEAMAAGKPVVATAVGIAQEIIKNGDNGLLVKPGSAEEIGKAMLILFSDDNKRMEMGDSARRTIEDRFSRNKMIKEYEIAYRSLIDK